MNLNALLGASGLALVWLRKGDKEGLFAAAWALIPALCIAYQFNSYYPLALLVPACLASAALRVTSRWSLTLIALSAGSIITSFIVMVFGSESLQVYITAYEQITTQIQQQAMQNPELVKLLPKTLQLSTVAGVLGTTLILSSFLSLLIARYYQAKLFNPGGLQEEFHTLRLSRIETLAALLVTGFFIIQAHAYLSWIWMSIFPLLISGIAFFHFFAKQKKLATPWYVLFYIVLIVWNPFKIMMVTLAILDSFTPIRQRIQQASKE